MTYEFVDIYCETDYKPAMPLEGVIVRVTSSDGVLTYGQGISDVDGVVRLLLPSNITFQVRAYKFSVKFGAPKLIVVEQSPAVNTFVLVGEVYRYPESNDARICLASGLFRTPSGASAPNIDMHFIGKFDPVLLDGAPILVERVSTRTDNKGWASIPLIRHACYDVMIEGIEWTTRPVTVPDTSWVNLGDLIFPRVKSVVFDPKVPGNALSMVVGEELVLNATAWTTSRYDLDDVTSELAWSLTNSDVVSFTLTPTSITLKARSPGTSQLVAQRRDTTTIVIPNLSVEGVPITITVT